MVSSGLEVGGCCVVGCCAVLLVGVIQNINKCVLYQTLFRLQEIRLLYLMNSLTAALPSLPSSPLPAIPDQHCTFYFKKTTICDAPTVLLDFGSARCEELAGTAEPQQFRAWPVFNDDRRYFTPCFMLQHDKVRTPHNLPAFFSLHLSRVAEIAEQREEMLVPRPSNNNSFCCVCKTFFDGYLQHLARPDHSQLMRSNKFGKDIGALCARFANPLPKAKPKVKAIRKQHARKVRKEEVKQLQRSVSTQVSSALMGEIRS